MRFVLVLALLALAPRVEAQDADRVEAERAFTLGVELAAEGDTTGALAAFRAARAGGTSAAVEHNVARLALARNDVGTARLAAERAYRLAPTLDGVPEVLTAAREAVGEAPPPAIRRRLDATVGVLRPLGVVLLALLFAALAALTVRSRRRLPGALVGVSVGLGALAVVAAGALLAERSTFTAVVVETVAARAAPSPEAAPGARLDAGRITRIVERRPGWAKLGGGLDVWVPASAVEEI